MSAGKKNNNPNNNKSFNSNKNLTANSNSKAAPQHNTVIKAGKTPKQESDNRGSMNFGQKIIDSLIRVKENVKFSKFSPVSASQTKPKSKKPENNKIN